MFAISGMMATTVLATFYRFGSSCTSTLDVPWSSYTSSWSECRESTICWNMRCHLLDDPIPNSVSQWGGGEYTIGCDDPAANRDGSSFYFVLKAILTLGDEGELSTASHKILQHARQEESTCTIDTIAIMGHHHGQWGSDCTYRSVKMICVKVRHTTTIRLPLFQGTKLLQW
jgi:hypothetical protein